MIVGLLVGLAIALGVALYITKAPVPWMNKVQQRTAEQDAAEAERNKNWDPNAPLAGKAAAKSASGVISPPKPAAEAPMPAAASAPAAPAPAKSEAKPDKAAAAASAAAASADGFTYFVQVGAFAKPDDAEQQRAKLALLGFSAKVFERDQAGRVVYRVRLGPFDKKEEADAQQQKVEASGLEAQLVRVQR